MRDTSKTFFYAVRKREFGGGHGGFAIRSSPGQEPNSCNLARATQIAAEQKPVRSLRTGAAISSSLPLSNEQSH